MTLGPYHWTVKHRYSDFHDLHEKLTSTYKLDKKLLPPKKYFGNQNETFIKRRQTELEVYLQTVLYYLIRKVPNCLATFLDFPKYEIHGITQIMAEELYNRGDLILQTREMYLMTPLQLYALTERLKLPEPTCDSGDLKKDIGHILDFITRLKVLKVKGNNVSIGTSNINMNHLKFDLTLFKSLQVLQLENCSPLMIGGVETIKQTLEKMTIYNSLDAIKDMLLQEIPRWRSEDGALLVSNWDHLRQADFSRNSITSIDDSVQMIPKVEVLDLSCNEIDAIQHLQWLSQMTSLNISNNFLQRLDALHTKLGNIKTLNLAGNKLDSLQGLSKLFSLKTLDVRDNKITIVSEVRPVCRLPCLENLFLLGNPVTMVLDYRTKILEMFGDRVGEELDTVAGLQAIKKSKEKAKAISPRRNSSRTSLSKSSSQASLTFDPETFDNLVKNPTSTSLPSENPDIVFPIMHSAPSTTVGWNIPNAQNPYHGQVNTLQVQGRKVSPQCHETLQDQGKKLSQTQPETLQDQGKESWRDMLSIIQVAEDGPKRKQTHDIYIPSSLPENFISSAADNVLLDFEKSSTIEKQRALTEGTEPSPAVLEIMSLPDNLNEDFTLYLQKRLFGTTAESEENLERIKNIVWGSTLQYSNQNSVFPACVILTERRIFILKVRGPDFEYEGVPKLETFYILPLSNIQQVVIGACYSYFRLEESFVGSMGTFIIFAPDSDLGKLFTDDIISASREFEAAGELDIVNCSQQSDIVRYIFDVEERDGYCTGRVAFAASVIIAESGHLAVILLSENKVYILRYSTLFWPLPTFESSKPVKAPFDCLYQHTVTARISDIRMYTPDNVQQTKLKRGNISGDMSLAENSKFRFYMFGLSMTFHELIGHQRFSVIFLSIKARDTFLDRLTNLRAEHAHRMSPTIREEPEGGNELSDSSERLTPEIRIDKVAETPEKSSMMQTQSEVDIRKKRGKSVEGGLSSEGLYDGNSSAYSYLYLTPELVRNLSICIQDYTLVHPLPSKLKVLSQMDGTELACFFHANIAMIGVEAEELHYVTWVYVMPYRNPNDEIITCVMMSSRAVYLVSDRMVVSPAQVRPSWMTHSRNKSDSIVMWQKRKSSPASVKCAIVKPYAILQYSEVQQVNVGLFDQYIRLTGQNRDSVFTLVTRNSNISEKLIQQLSVMLSVYQFSPALEKSTTELEQDFYQAFSKYNKTTLGVGDMEYAHPSHVLFCYPGQDTVADLLFVVDDYLSDLTENRKKSLILMYLLVYHLPSSVSDTNNFNVAEPRSIVLLKDYFCLLSEDLVSYPLPDFSRGLPEMPRQKVTEAKKLDFLKRILINHDKEREITLVFSDEEDEIVVDHSLQHFGSREQASGRQSPPECSVRLLIPSQREREKFLQILKCQWSELHDGLDAPFMIQ
ncbi:hypothetical protein ScPMuIL_008825 [Solemya velum]